MKIIVALSFSHQACVASLFTIEMRDHVFSQEEACELLDICLEMFQMFRDGEDSLETVIEKSIDELDECFSFIESYFTYIDGNILYYGFEVSESILREDEDPELLLLVEKSDSEVVTVYFNGEGSSEHFISTLTSI